MFRTTGVTGTDARHPAPARRSARAAGCRGDTRQRAARGGTPPFLTEGMGQPGCSIPLVEGCALPDPPAGRGVGKPGFPTPLRDEQRLFLGGLRPPRPSHRVRVGGNQVSPLPLREGQDPPADRGMGKPGFPTPLRDERRLFLGGRRPPKPSHRVRGRGKPGFPIPLLPEIMFTLVVYCTSGSNLPHRGVFWIASKPLPTASSATSIR